MVRFKLLVTPKQIRLRYVVFPTRRMEQDLKHLSSRGLYPVAEHPTIHTTKADGEIDCRRMAPVGPY